MPDGGPGDRFPGFDVLDQAGHWDAVTTRVVLQRLQPHGPTRFFTAAELAAATALTDLLLDQDGESRLPVVEMIDARLAGGETDGWHYEDMPADADAWRATLAHLDADARDRAATDFVGCDTNDQAAIVQQVQDLGSQQWHGMVAERVWSLWTRYACTAFYAHPQAWNEIGFPGPAYPRGYKNAGVGSREPFEVPDAAPLDDPVRRTR